MRGVPIVIISFILFFTIPLRTIVTFFKLDYKVSIDIITLLNPGNEVNFPSSIHITTRVTHICSFIIWILGSLIPFSLLVAMKTYMKNIVTILSVHGNVLSFIVTVFAVCYEVWMFSYIFVSYALSCAFIVQLVMVMPFCALITHSIHQAMFLIQYARTEVCPRNVPLEQFLFHLYISGFFNFIMFIHLICMTVTAVFTEGISKNWNIEKYVIVFLGVAELLYRGYALYCYSTLYIEYKPISDPGSKMKEYNFVNDKESNDDTSILYSTCETTKMLLSASDIEQQEKEKQLDTERNKPIEELRLDLKDMKQRKIEGSSSFQTKREAGDTIFLLQGSSQPQYFNWEKYGLSLSAPEGILPPSETCEVAITALGGGEFEFPKDGELVSTVYSISISKPLLKPLTINIQHCVRDKLIELQQSLHLKALDLAVIPKTRDLSTDHVFEKTQMKSAHLHEKEYEQLSMREKLIFENLQQNTLLKALDLAVIPKVLNLLTIKGLKEMQTMTKEKESTLSNSENIGLLDIQDKMNEQLQVSNEKCIQCDHWNSPNIPDLFEGMVTVGKDVCFYKTDSDHEFKIEECGLRLIIPAEVIKSTEFVDEYEVAAQGLWGGKFEFPKGSKLISGVCYISVSSTSLLDKAVTIELEHCAVIIDETQSQYLSFVIADHKSGPPFKFKKLSGGCFFPNSQIGSISIKSFSLVAIVLFTVVGVAGDGMAGAVAGGLVGGVVGGIVSTAATATVALAAGAFIGSKIERGLTTYHNVTCSYEGHVFYKRENRRKWNCNFVVTQSTKYSNSLLDFFGKIHYSFRFCFTKANLELKGFPSENRKIHGWTIIPHVIPTIIKVRDVDEFSSSEQAKPPSISMGITAHPDDSDFKEDFQYFLTVEGVDCGKEKNVKDFILGFIIPSQSKIVIDISLLSDNTHTILNTCPGENELLGLLASIDSDWYKIGKALKVSHNTLQGLRHNNESNTVRLEEVIHSWITTQSSPVTWQTMIDAIGGNIVNKKAKADEICEYLRPA